MTIGGGSLLLVLAMLASMPVTDTDPPTGAASAQAAMAIGAQVGHTDLGPADPRWSWPLRPRPRVVHGFDPPAQRWLSGHRGIDLAGTAGVPVRSVESGVVSFSGLIAGVGVVALTHADGLRSTYQPVQARVRRGEPVTAGEQLGVLGGVGDHCPMRTCLHLGAVRGRETYVDPLLFLQAWQVSLQPLAP